VNSPFDVETENLDPIVVFPIDGFLSSIEFFPLVNIFTASITSPKFWTSFYNQGRAGKPTYIENGAMRRTTCCEFLGAFRLGMRSGSKSGGKYLLRTAMCVSVVVNEPAMQQTFSLGHDSC